MRTENLPECQRLGASTQINTNWIKLACFLFITFNDTASGLKIDNVTQTHASGTGQITSRDAASCISACLLLYSGFCCFYLFWRYVNESAVAPRPHTLHICIYECVQSTPIQKTLMTCDYGNKIMRCFIGRRTIKRWRGKKKASLSPSPTWPFTLCLLINQSRGSVYITYIFVFSSHALGDATQ